MTNETQEILDGIRFWLSERNDITGAGKATLFSMLSSLEDSLNADNKTSN